MFEAVVTLTKGVAGGGGGGDGGGGAGALPPPPPPQAPRYSPETTPNTASPTRIAWPTPQRPSGAHAVLHQVLDTSIEFLRFLDTTCDWRLVQCRIAGSRAPGRRRPGVSSEPVALRTVADAVGGMAALAEKTGLSRETLYRTLSEKGNPRLDTLIAILAAFGLRLSVQPDQPCHRRRAHA